MQQYIERLVIVMILRVKIVINIVSKAFFKSKNVEYYLLYILFIILLLLLLKRTKPKFPKKII